MGQSRPHADACRAGTVTAPVRGCGPREAAASRGARINAFPYRRQAGPPCATWRYARPRATSTGVFPPPHREARPVFPAAARPPPPRPWQCSKVHTSTTVSGQGSARPCHPRCAPGLRAAPPSWWGGGSQYALDGIHGVSLLFSISLTGAKGYVVQGWGGSFLKMRANPKCTGKVAGVRTKCMAKKGPGSWHGRNVHLIFGGKMV